MKQIMIFCHYCPVLSLTNIIINNKFYSKYYHHHCLISLSSKTIHVAFSRIAEHLEESLPNLETIVMTSNNMQELVCLT